MSIVLITVSRAWTLRLGAVTWGVAVLGWCCDCVSGGWLWCVVFYGRVFLVLWCADVDAV